MLNNTAQDYRPFILTAFHCIDLDKDQVLSTGEIANSEDWLVRFRFRHTTCGGSTIANVITYDDTFFRSAWNTSDFALVELQDNIINDASSVGQKVWLGWDRSGNIPTSGTCIHHPSGDIAKISLENNSLTETNYLQSTGTSHWKVFNWDYGVTEEGSSGSPLFDQNKRVVGQLHGGYSGCDVYTYLGHNYGPDEPDWYGCFHRSWTGGGTNTTRLSNWLDPCGSGALTTNISRAPYISGPSLVCSSGNTFTISNSVGSINWIPGPGLTITSQNTTSCTFSSTGTGSSWVGATLVTNCGSITLPQKDIWRGAPVITGISGPTTTPNNMWASYSAVLANNSTPTEYNWILSPLNGNYVYNYGNSVTISFYNWGYYRLQVQAKNACTGAGYGPIYETTIYVYNAFGLAITPNPATGEATIRLVGENKDAPVALTEWDCEIYDPMQSLKEKKTKLKTIETKINISGWMDGVYIVRAKVGDKILSEKLVVKH